MTKDFLNNKDQAIAVSIMYVGAKSSPNFDADASRHNQVTIRNKSTRKRATFDYWGSMYEPNQDNEDGLKGALDCILLDIEAYENARDFNDFCAEFGYDADSRKAENIYKACGKELEKFNRVVDDDSVRDDIRNWIENN